MAETRSSVANDIPKYRPASDARYGLEESPGNFGEHYQRGLDAVAAAGGLDYECTNPECRRNDWRVWRAVWNALPHMGRQPANPAIRNVAQKFRDAVRRSLDVQAHVAEDLKKASYESEYTKSYKLLQNSIQAEKEKRPHSGTYLHKREYASPRDTKLRAMWPVIGTLRKLKEIDYYGQQLSALPDSLELPPKLETVILSRNNFTSVPDVLERMLSLHVLRIDQNPIPARAIAKARRDMPDVTIHDQRRVGHLPLVFHEGLPAKFYTDKGLLRG